MHDLLTVTLHEPLEHGTPLATAQRRHEVGVALHGGRLCRHRRRHALVNIHIYRWLHCLDTPPGPGQLQSAGLATE
jgi:hypothetical protein